MEFAGLGVTAELLEAGAAGHHLPKPLSAPSPRWLFQIEAKPCRCVFSERPSRAPFEDGSQILPPFWKLSLTESNQKPDGKAG